jgi:adenine-specific DNA-methyltransferase
MVERLFRGAAVCRNHSILDAGCGTGVFIEGIVRWCTVHGTEIPRLVGIESHPGRVRAARESFRAYGQVEVRKQDFLKDPVEKFDFIIGNPPYVPITGLIEDEKSLYRSLFESARGRFDLYLLFFEKALKNLNPGGRLVFITPEKFLYVESARPLRKLLSELQVEEILLVDEAAFGDLLTYPTITTVVNRRAVRPASVVLRDGRSTEVVLARDAASWMPLIWGARRPRQSWITLGDLCLRISCGVATGCDSVFVRLTSQLSPDLLGFAYPTIAGRELNSAGTLTSPTYSMLIPYAKNGSLLREHDLGALGRYLLQSHLRQRLMARTCVRRKPWYAFHETPMLSDILRPKILCKDITRAPRFWVDRKGTLVPRHSVYYIVPRNPSILNDLCEYLNSDRAAQWLRAHCQRAANNFLRIQSNVIKQMPVPAKFASATVRSLFVAAEDDSEQARGSAEVRASR